jgi:vitamin B12 transporter
MQLKQLSLVAAISALIFTTTTNAVLGPIPIYLNTEYRTDAPVIGSISSTLTFTESDIKATGANTFLDFLATVPSIALSNPQGNVPGVFIRGGRSEDTLFVLDGVSMTSADSLNGAIEYGLTTIPLNDIEKIEIVKGSGSVLYGSGAITAVISITTKKGADGTRGTISVKFGTHNSKTYALSASGGSKDGYIRFSHNNHNTDGINSQTGDNTQESDSINNQSTQITVGNEQINISYLKARNKTEYDGWGGTNGEELGDTKLTKVAASTNKKFSNTWKSKLSIAQTKSSRDSGINAATIGDKYKTTSITLFNNVMLDEALLNIGVSKIDNENTTRYKKMSTNNLFVNWQKNINSIDVNSGARYIKHNKFGKKTVYNLGAAKLFDSGFKLTASHATAFKTPTLKNLYGWNFASTGNGYTSGGGNLELNPETSKNTELGIEKEQDWGILSAKIYNNKVNDAIDWKADPTPDSWNGQYINRDELTTKGVELSVNANLSGYDINFTHNHNKSIIKDTATQAVKRPKNITNLVISRQYGKFNSKAQVIKKSSHDIDNLKGFTLLNLSTSYDINQQAKVSLNVNNATDKKYQTVNGYNELERTIEMSLIYNF